MRAKSLGYRLGMVAFLGAVLAVGFAAMDQSQVLAVKPEPDCGPTYQWICVVPGCPTCPDVLFEGTICEKTIFEMQTGRVCTPF